jgi:hypothetical protein
MIGLVLAVYLVQYRFIRQDVHDVQARYIAEGGVYAAIDVFVIPVGNPSIHS